ncbi:hypothetical protein RJT34_12380 [Clitoria ternatea]|uniref:Uncharacterized protein n=1 Tax=Clitoria ternatea TaxID=43366 RepID=A0AAN9JNQ6_CLITE
MNTKGNEDHCFLPSLNLLGLLHLLTRFHVGAAIRHHLLKTHSSHRPPLSDHLAIHMDIQQVQMHAQIFVYGALTGLDSEELLEQLLALQHLLYRLIRPNDYLCLNPSLFGSIEGHRASV